MPSQDVLSITFVWQLIIWFWRHFLVLCIFSWLGYWKMSSFLNLFLLLQITCVMMIRCWAIWFHGSKYKILTHVQLNSLTFQEIKKKTNKNCNQILIPRFSSSTSSAVFHTMWKSFIFFFLNRKILLKLRKVPSRKAAAPYFSVCAPRSAVLQDTHKQTSPFKRLHVHPDPVYPVPMYPSRMEQLILVSDVVYEIHTLLDSASWTATSSGKPV